MATTPVDPRVAAKMQRYLTVEGAFGNPASQHSYGWEAQEAIEEARQQVAQAIHAESKSIVWTSGATEAINLALKGAADFYQRKGKHIITWATEHSAVLNVCGYLESQGFEVTYLKPHPNGLVDLKVLEKALRNETVLVSVAQVNNEIGVIQDIAAISQRVHEKGALLHVDAAQSVGKVAINVHVMGVDLLSLSAHKAYGPKGIGALYLRQQPRVRLTPQIQGGGHENGVRGGTLPTHQIVGMGAALALAEKEREAEVPRIMQLRNYLWEGLQKLEGIYLNGDWEHRVAHNLNIRVEGVEGETLLTALHSLALSSGSACNAVTHEPSHVLLALGLNRLEADRAIRISLGRFTTSEEIEFALEQMTTQIQRLRNISGYS